MSSGDLRYASVASPLPKVQEPEAAVGPWGKKGSIRKIWEPEPEWRTELRKPALYGAESSIMNLPYTKFRKVECEKVQSGHVMSLLMSPKTSQHLALPARR